MAHLRETRPSIVIWDQICKKWTWYTGQNAPSKVGAIKNFFNTFISTHRGYEFTVAQIYSGLYEVGITCQQYDEIKRQLERVARLTLPDIRLSEFLEGGFIERRSFGNFNEFRRVVENDLRTKNRSIIREKYVEAKKHYDKVKEVFKQPQEKVILSFDLEVYEHDFDKTLEIGYTVVHFSPNVPGGPLPVIEVTSKRHFIIEENLHYKNKDFVPDNRDGFKFGSSETVSLVEAVEMFRIDVENCDFLLGHCVKHDDEYLKKIDVDLSKLKKEMLDTQLIEMHKEIKPNDDRFFMRGLSYLLKEYKVNYQDADLHNAGCDAYYTMMAFLRQMGYSVATVNELSTRF